MPRDDRDYRDRGYHFHFMSTMTSFDQGHRHGMYHGTSVEANTRDHRHDYRGKTTYNQGHDHSFRGRTGRPVPFLFSHVHRFEGDTSYDRGHDHEYRDFTGPARFDRYYYDR